MRNDFFFFFGIFFFIFVIWAGTGGPSRPISWAGPFLNPPAPLGSGTAYSLPSAGFNIGAFAGGLGNLPRQAEQVAEDMGELEKQLAAAKKFGEPSVYRGLVTFERYSSGPKATTAKNESVSIRLSSRANESVRIDGWKLVSSVTGQSATIPQGTEIPRSGIINAIEPIMLRPGDTAAISTGRSPIGASFRENRCIGYFEQYQKFTPSLPKTCPVPEDEFDRFYDAPLRDDTCRTFIKAIPRCTLISSIPPIFASTCGGFIGTYLNYNGCITAHGSERDFLGTSWRIFIGRDSELWKAKYETIKLIDRDGKTVDLYAY